jgi:hypothetical protein
MLLNLSRRVERGQDIGTGQVVYPKSEAKPSNDMGHLKLNNLLIYGGLLEIYNTYGYASFLISAA